MDRLISKLEQEIISDEKNIEDRIKRGRKITQSAYYVLSTKYNKLFLLNKDEKAFNSAIDNINKAILMNSEEDLQYLAQRADIYISSEKYDKAEEDITIIRNLISNMPSCLEKLYVESIIKKFDLKNFF